MSRRLVLPLLAVLLATGCAVLYPEAGIARDWRERRVEWVEQNGSGLSPEVRQAIIDGCVVAGMTVEQARAAWMQAVPPWRTPGRRTVLGRTVVDAHEFKSVSGRRVFYTVDGRLVAAQADVDVPAYRCAETAVAGT